MEPKQLRVELVARLIDINSMLDDNMMLELSVFRLPLECFTLNAELRHNDDDSTYLAESIEANGLSKRLTMYSEQYEGNELAKWGQK